YRDREWKTSAKGENQSARRSPTKHGNTFRHTPASRQLERCAYYSGLSVMANWISQIAILLGTHRGFALLGIGRQSPLLTHGARYPKRNPPRSRVAGSPCLSLSPVFGGEVK